ncbi:D-ribitol-5-phosphate cytidylyltransferase-like [Argonauta hians]
MSLECDPVDFDVCVVLPAGGYGVRTGVPTPKQFWSVSHKPLIVYTIQEFNRIPWIRKIIVSVAKDRVESFEEFIDHYHLTKVDIAVAGAFRHQSIYNGIKKLNTLDQPPDVVLVHDAVRPLIDETIIRQVAVAAEKYGAAGIVNPVTSDVLSVTPHHFLCECLDRHLYQASEMPQGFRFDCLKESYDLCSQNDIEFGTECLHLVQKYSKVSAYLVEGPPLWKVTFRRDYFAVEASLKEKYLRIGLTNITSTGLVTALKCQLEEHHIQVSVLDSLQEPRTKELTSVVLGQNIEDLDEILGTTEKLAQIWTAPTRFVNGGMIIFLISYSKKDRFSKTFSQVQKYATILAEDSKTRISPIFVLTKELTNNERLVKFIKSLLWDISDVNTAQVFVV